MAVVNLGLKYAKQIQERFALDSLLQGRLEEDIEFVGAKTVRVHTIGTVPLRDYDRKASGNRYGLPEEVGDTVQELTMEQDKSFTGIIDKGNTKDQAINKAGKFLKTQLDQVVIPFKDKHGFKVIAHKAGGIYGDTLAIGKANVIERLAKGRELLLNKRVPTKGRTLFVSTAMYNALVETDQFKNLDTLGSKAMAKGQVGEIMGSPVVEVPADLLPKNVNFIWAHKSAGASPSKIAETQMHTDPPGISGHLVEGRYYFDTFVSEAKAEGIYVDVTTNGEVKVLSAPTVNASTGAVAGSGGEVYYTLDGSDPRYSLSAQQGTAPVVPAGRKTTVKAAVRAKVSEENSYNSAVTMQEFGS